MRRGVFNFTGIPRPYLEDRKPEASESDSDDSIDAQFERYRAVSKARYKDLSLRPVFKTPKRRVRRSRSAVSNQERPKTSPAPIRLGVCGQSVVGSSIGHVRSQKFEVFEEKPVLNTTLPMDWVGIRGTPARTPGKRPHYETNEQRSINHVMTKWDFQSAAKTLASIEANRKRLLDSQKVPDWARGGGTGPMFQSRSPTKKAKVISRAMVEKDADIV